MSKPIYPQNSKLESAGFTLVELMVTVAIMAIIAGLTFGNLNSTSYRLKSTAKTLKANMQKARLLAVKENCPVYVDFDLDNGGGSDGTVNNYYSLWKDIDNDNPPTFDMLDASGNVVVNKKDSREFIEDTPLPNNISFGTIANGNGGPAAGPGGAVLQADGVSYNGNRARFSPQGTSGNGWTYLCAPANDEAGTHAVGTNNIGRVHS
ncbi:MAG: prepilin-type N-terminal cleavage/methylation domain-containing protein, partial [Deltaproteobacteria bacterium]|nr:prepilin-type N-terminal cleavage/methylation domain-containing protein [Candidatus Tharpellaceae bacterium]